MGPESRAFLVRAWERQYDEAREDAQSVRTRGIALLTATGVISGVLTLLLPVTAALRVALNLNSPGSIIPILVAAIAFFLMLWCATGTVVLAIKAQAVGVWSQSSVKPLQGRDMVGYELEYAFNTYVAGADNINRLANPAGYLRQAQWYFMSLVFALTALVLASALTVVLGAATASSGASAPHTKPLPTATIASSGARTSPNGP